jgi:hypothetical protein
MRLGWGLKNPAFCKLFTCRFIPEATPSTSSGSTSSSACRHRPRTPARLMERDDDIDVRPCCLA